MKNNIDEINIFNNGDGTYSLEVNMSSGTVHTVLAIPRAALNFSVSMNYTETEVTLELSGVVERYGK